MKPLQFILTKDGSHTLWNEELDETYHSRHGAVQEAKHVFIETGLKHVLKNRNDISILEVGFGTGLNAWLTLLELSLLEKKAKYTGIELYPVALDVIEQLNYADEHGKDLFKKIHSFEWNSWNQVSSGNQLLKQKVSLEDFQTEEKFDLIYFDAFGPNSQPSMWEPQLLKKCADLLNLGGVFVTYCCKGQVRRDLISAGLDMEKLPGPPGKREMLRGIK
ncbi:MAG: tRNA (5-methylaminomethyl-2-thiouridine)(34)-methyltransferase MnmD [Flavobacteriales bacterium]